MKLWLVHSEEVTLREQIVRQVTLGVLSGELSPGERLPSVREMARRFQVHPNTVGSAYQQLRNEGWVEGRHGSGMYIRSRVAADAGLHGDAVVLEGLLARVVQAARELKVSESEVQSRLAQAWSGPKRLLLLEPDAELAKLVQHECVHGGCERPMVCDLPLNAWPAQLSKVVRGFTPAVLPSKAASAQEALGQDASLFVFGISPAAQTLARNLPVSRDHLVGIASAWPQFLEMAQTLLIATGFSSDALLVRDTREKDWAAGLRGAAAVVCDTLTATRLQPGINALVFPLLSEQALKQLRQREEHMR